MLGQTSEEERQCNMNAVNRIFCKMRAKYIFIVDHAPAWRFASGSLEELTDFSHSSLYYIFH